MPRSQAFAVLALALSLAACGGGEDAATSAVPANKPPVVAIANPDLPAVLGAAFSYDASQANSTFSDPNGDALSYSVVLSAAGTGLSASGALISGTPVVGGRVAVTVLADDGRGATATDSFDLLLVPGRTPRLADPVLPVTPFSYADAAVGLPAHFVAPAVAVMDNTPADNPITDAGATLGRVLFYDTRLSVTDNVSCASCHQQAFGFSDPMQRSEGFAGGFTGRHSMGLANARYYARGAMFWDERAISLEAQALMPIQDAVEMGLTLDALEAKLAATAFYPPLFQAAFGTPDVTRDRIAKSLAQFERAMVSYRTRFDTAFNANGVPDFVAVLTAQEEQGRQLFIAPVVGGGRTARCAACHDVPTHALDTIHNIGLDAVATDVGAGAGRFKAPSLRNIAVRSPYMHDGRFTTLEQVVEFYDSSVQFNPALSPVLTAAPGQAVRLGLTDEEKAALVAFLRTLTDEELLGDARFADPFPL